jgi:hypothetical protein
MAHFKRGRIDKTDSRRFSPPEKLGIDKQGDEGATGQFHKPVVTDRSGEKAAEMKAEVTLVIPFETAITAEVEQQDNGHYLTQGQAARRKPSSFFVP